MVYFLGERFYCKLHLSIFFQLIDTWRIYKNFYVLNLPNLGLMTRIRIIHNPVYLPHAFLFFLLLFIFFFLFIYFNFLLLFFFLWLRFDYRFLEVLIFICSLFTFFLAFRSFGVSRFLAWPFTEPFWKFGC